MSQVNFDPNAPDFISDPYPTYSRLHQESPIFWHEPSNMWFVATHEDLVTLMRDRRLGRQISHIDPSRLPARNPDYAPFDMLSDNSLFDKEPPDHTRIKNLVIKVFTPRRVEALRGKITTICENLLDQVQGQGTMDLLQDYAVPIPVMVIAELLGVPEADRYQLRPWSAAIIKMYELSHTPEAARNAVRASQEFSDYLRNLSRQRRLDPRDDLVSALALVEDHGETLTENELISTCILLLNAGHEATVNAFGNGMRALFHHPQPIGATQGKP
jgi:cytochrome P450